MLCLNSLRGNTSRPTWFMTILRLYLLEFSVLEFQETAAWYG